MISLVDLELGLQFDYKMDKVASAGDFHGGSLFFQRYECGHPNLGAIFETIDLRSALGFLEMKYTFAIIMIPVPFFSNGSSECDRRNYI